MKKKVTAPLTYNPGKGRPKEHLAYLNWQEMEALKRLNGNNQERGPMGLPSFPPADARGSSSKASSSKSTGARGPGASMAAAKASSKASAGAQKSQAASKPRSSVARGEGAAAGLSGNRTKTMKEPVNYSPPPRYRQPQAERIFNPTAIPTAERSVYERMNAADAQKSVKAALDARIQRANQARQAEVARAGLFGAPSYTGTYNPKTGKFDARPTAATAPQTVDRTGKVNYGPVLRSGTETMWGGPPQTVNRIGKTNLPPSRLSGTETEWGGPTVDVANRAGKIDLPAREPSIGETVSDYVGRAYDTVYGGIRAIGEALPPNVFTPRSPDTFTDKIGPRLAYGAPIGPQRPEPSQTVYKNAALSAEEISGAPYGRVGNADPAALDTYSDSVPLGSFTPPTREIDLTQEAYNRAMSGNIMRNQYAVDVRKDALSRINEALDYYKNLGEKPPAAKTRGLTIQPMGSEVVPEENILSVEDMPEETPLGLTGKAARKAAKKAGIPASVYNQPGFADDVDQLGIGAPVDGPISATDMAKLHARAYGGAYLTPAERKQATVAKGILRAGQTALNATVPFSGTLAKGVGKLTGAEPVEAFLGRPSYEQDYLRDIARAENIRYGRDPLGRESYTTADGQVVNAPVSGGIGSGRSSDERGLASGVSAIPTATPVVAPTSTASSGARPEIYYYWDLSLNIPSPTDPNYTQYQEYLRQRAAAQAAMYGTV